MRAARLAALFAVGTITAPLAAGPGFAPVEIRTIPIAKFLAGSDETHFGSLEFLGGLELLSRDRDFGALSGLDFAPDGKTLYSNTDTSFWFTAGLTEENGRPVGLADTRMGPMLGEDGKPPDTKADGDAEAVRLVERNGVLTALVSFEQVPAVREFSGPDFATAVPKRLKLPKSVKGMRRNQGLEALAVAPAGGRFAGATVVIAERSLDASGNHRGFILGGPRPGAFSIRRSEEFDVTDATFLPDGDLLILERRFSYSGGFAMRIRRIAGSTIMPAATVDGTTLIEADTDYQIDNMEGLAVRTSASGETLITIVSDNNNSLLQRTLLLQFSLQPTVPPLPHARPKP